MQTRWIFFCFLLASTTSAQGQAWALHLNLNEYYPLGNKLKGYHPIL